MITCPETSRIILKQKSSSPFGGEEPLWGSASPGDYAGDVGATGGERSFVVVVLLLHTNDGSASISRRLHSHASLNEETTKKESTPRAVGR